MMAIKVKVYDLLTCFAASNAAPSSDLHVDVAISACLRDIQLMLPLLTTNTNPVRVARLRVRVLKVDVAVRNECHAAKDSPSVDALAASPSSTVSSLTLLIGSQATSCLSLVITANVLFILFASADRQSFALTHEERKQQQQQQQQRSRSIVPLSDFS